jgi:hypothetical protein
VPAGIVSSLRAAESRSSADRVIRVGPGAQILGASPRARLSLEKKDAVHWTSEEEPLSIVFPVDGFPVLEDGTKVDLPPLEGMHRNEEKSKWLPGGAVRNGGAVNPELAPLLSKAKDGELVYSYHIHLGTSWGYGQLIVQH